MTIRPGVNLGEAFESLKNTLIETEKKTKEEKPTTFDTGLKYADAYGRLSAAVQFHIAWNTDTDFSFLQKALETPENGSGEAPTLLLYDALHWEDEPNDIPEELFNKPGQPTN